MKPLPYWHRQQAIEVLSPEDFMPPSPIARAKFDALADDDPWKVGLRAVEARARGCEWCAEGIRCDHCGERMCADFGPEPRTCGTTCGDCPCDCPGCLAVRDDMRAELLRQIERES